MTETTDPTAGERRAENDVAAEAFERGLSSAQFRLAADFTDAILRDIFQGMKDHLRGQMLDVAAKVARRNPWPYFEECVEAEVQKRVTPPAVPATPDAGGRERGAERGRAEGSAVGHAG